MPGAHVCSYTQKSQSRATRHSKVCLISPFHLSLPQVGAFLGLLCSRAASLSPQDVSNTLTALVRLRHRPPLPIMSTLISTLSTLLNRFHPNELTTAVYALARLRFRLSESLLARLFDVSGRSFAKADPGYLAIQLWSYESMGVVPPQAWLERLVIENNERLPVSVES